MHDHPRMTTILGVIAALAAATGVAAAGTPQDIIAKLSGGIAHALDTAGMKEQLDRQGVESRSSTPAEFQAFMESELIKWGKVVKDSGTRRLSIPSAVRGIE